MAYLITAQIVLLVFTAGAGAYTVMQASKPAKVDGSVGAVMARRKNEMGSK